MSRRSRTSRAARRGGSGPTSAVATLPKPSLEPAVNDATSPQNQPAAEPDTFTGGLALDAAEDLTWAELTAMATELKAATEQKPQALEGDTMTAEVKAARQLLAEAEERGEDPMSLGHAVAYLDSIHKAIGRQIKVARTRAEEVYAAAQLVTGMRSIGVSLDDGGPDVCTVHIQDPEPEIIWDRNAVLAYCRAHASHNLLDVVAAHALDIPEVVAFVKMFHPECVRTEVRPAYLTLLAQEINEEGVKADPNGEPHKLATIRPPVRTGAFRLTYTKPKGHAEGKERIAAAFRSGILGDVLALGPAPDPDPEEND